MKTPGQIAYEAYMNWTGGVSLISAQELPEWEDACDDIKAAWEAAAQAVLNANQ